MGDLPATWRASPACNPQKQKLMRQENSLLSDVRTLYYVGTRHGRFIRWHGPARGTQLYELLTSLYPGLTHLNFHSNFMPRIFVLEQAFEQRRRNSRSFEQRADALGVPILSVSVHLSDIDDLSDDELLERLVVRYSNAVRRSEHNIRCLCG